MMLLQMLTILQVTLLLQRHLPLCLHCSNARQLLQSRTAAQRMQHRAV
jgi:hypothetical protein